QALQSDLALQKYFINYLCSNGWFNDAIRWVVFFNLIDSAPRCLQPYLCNNTVLEAQADLAKYMIISERASVTNVELFPGHPIKMIATLEDLEELYPVIKEADLIGIDTEWKPLFMCTINDQMTYSIYRQNLFPCFSVRLNLISKKVFQVALFQVCVQQCSYLIDVITLEKVLTEEQWLRFFKALFSDSTAIKLGFDFLNDLRVLYASFPYLQPLNEMKNMVCILKLVKSLLTSNPSFLDLSCSTSPSLSSETENLSNAISSDETVHFRLTDLCQKVLGEFLDKTEQIGNWAMRPLRREQMKYAAMDGYCLLNLYDKLKIKAEREYQMDWIKHCMECDITQVKSKEEKKPKKKGAKFDDKEFEQMIEKCNSNSFVIAPSPVLETMYQANIGASNPFSRETYDAAKYIEKMREIDAELYSGYGCNLEVNENDCSKIVAHCHNGFLDIKNCLVAALGCDIPAEVKIEKVPLQVLEKEGRFFYVCGICGTIYWDGCHIVNYNAFVEPLFAEEK
ncbi:3'-5' exonuclease, partial [Onchocerca flexuosa]